MKLSLPVRLLLIVFAISTNAAAQQQSNKTLLWRISGNGLQTPSYLYGTMHLKDRRLFFFGDSVYKSLEASQGFAMELDPDAMMDSLYSKISEADTTSLLRKIIEAKEYKKVAKKLEKRFGMPADKITRKQLTQERDKWYYKNHKADDMQSAMDMYLYNIAHRQGKWVGGIEDVNDQMGILDEVGKDININEYLDDDIDVKRTSYLDNMVALYTDQDIDKLDTIFNSPQYTKTKDILLLHRNVKMAQRMDSLAKIRNSFFAVGAAHLPGDEGLIKLLQRKGFTVTPVFSSKKIAPEKYTYTAKEIPWIKFYEPDSAYTVEMPGKAGDLNALNGEVKFKVYADLATNNVYMTGYSFYAINETMDEMVTRMVNSFLAKGFIKTGDKKIFNKTIPGREIDALMGTISYRLQVFPFTDKVFVLMAGAEKKENLFSADVEKFIASFNMNASLAVKHNDWVSYRDTLLCFQGVFPKKPIINKIPSPQENRNVQTITFTSMDLANASYYMVAINEASKGFVMSTDSAVFEAKLEYYRSAKSLITDIRKFNYEGYGAMSFSAQTKQSNVEVVSKLLIICRGNKTYNVAVITQKGREDYPDAANFFRSFKLSNYNDLGWSANESNGGSFVTWSPAPFEKILPDTTGLSASELAQKLAENKKVIELVAYDKFASTTCNIHIYPAPKYYSAPSDSMFLDEQLRTYYSDTSTTFAKENPGRFDSLIFQKQISNGGVKGYEIIVKNGAKSYYKRIRILPHGDSSYHLFILAPYADIFSKANNKFFEDFRFKNENLPSAILKNKIPLAVEDLESKDSATKAGALTELADAAFTTADLAVLHNAFLKKYTFDTTAYKTVNQVLADAITSVNDTATISFIKSNFSNAVKDIPALQSPMLLMLANQHNSRAVQVLKEYLFRYSSGVENINAIVSALTDSLQLAQHLFPEAAEYFGDTFIGAGMISLAAQLLDSNLLQKDIWISNEAGVLTTAQNQLKKLQHNDYLAYSSQIINALEHINNKQAIQILNGFMAAKPLYTKQDALIALMKLKQPVPAGEIRKLAVDKGYRTYFYKALQTAGYQKMFTPEFLGQQQFAAAYLYNMAMDDDTDDASLTFLMEKVYSVNGVQKRFYLFKILFTYESGKESHLAISGPFNADKKVVLVGDEGENQKIFYEEKFSAATINKLVDKYITNYKLGLEKK